MESVLSWIIGLSVSLLIGMVTGPILCSIRKKYTDEHKPKDPRIPPTLVGLIERLFFTILIGAEISGGGVAMATWIFVKMATNWNGFKDDRAGAISGLLGSLISMFFALIGGLICRGRL